MNVQVYAGADEPTLSALFRALSSCWVPSSIMRKFIYKSVRTKSAQSRGTCPLSIILMDRRNNFHVELSSHKYSVNVNGEFLNSLKALGLAYNLVK